MKKIIAGLVSCALIFSLTACGGGGNTDKSDETTQGSTTEESEEPDETTEAAEETTEAADESEADESDPTEDNELAASNDTVALLQRIWASMPEELAFPSAGGDMENSVMGGAGLVATESTDYICNILLFPADFTTSIEEAASLGHMMNANNLTSGLYTLTAGTDLAAITTAYEALLADNMWLCGFPEKYLVMQLADNQIYIAYGFGDNIQAIQTQIMAEVPTATVLAEGDIA